MSKNKTLRKKIITIIIALLLIAFAVWNIVWLIYYNNMKHYLSNSNQKMSNKYSFGGRTYTFNTDEYIYNFSLPSYLKFNSFLNVGGYPGNYNSEKKWYLK